MLYISAGHNSKAVFRPDPGAVNKDGIKEGDLAIEYKRLVCIYLDILGAKYINDTDEETLSQYLQRIKTGAGSVIAEFHFDAGPPTATGCTGIVEAEADRLDRIFAKEMTDNTALILGIKNRGVISEAASHRGRLGLMREDGLICLLELGFITNVGDLAKYHARKNLLAKTHAEILMRYENLIV